MITINCLSERSKMLDAARRYRLNGLKLAIIQIEGDPASDVYIRNKVTTAERVGIEPIVIKHPSDVRVGEVKKSILEAAKTATGIILQLPLPAHLKIYQRALLDTIPPEMDVDGLTSTNVAKLWTGERGLIPATPAGIMRLLPEDLSGKTVTVVNRSDLVGKPLIKLLLDRHASVKACHSKTGAEALRYATMCSDYVITAIGSPRFFTAEYFSVGQTWIDCGINRVDGKLCGDIDTDSIRTMSNVAVTPVPNGVGALTTAQLMLNVVHAHVLQETKRRAKT